MVSGDLLNVANLRTLSLLETRSRTCQSNQALKDAQIVLDHLYLTLSRSPHQKSERLEINVTHF